MMLTSCVYRLARSTGPTHVDWRNALFMQDDMDCSSFTSDHWLLRGDVQRSNNRLDQGQQQTDNIMLCSHRRPAGKHRERVSCACSERCWSGRCFRVDMSTGRYTWPARERPQSSRMSRRTGGQGPSPLTRQGTASEFQDVQTDRRSRTGRRMRWHWVSYHQKTTEGHQSFATSLRSRDSRSHSGVWSSQTSRYWRW